MFIRDHKCTLEFSLLIFFTDIDMTLPLPRQETTKSTSLLERPSVSKTVTFNNTVETKPISPPLQYKVL